MIKDVLVKVQQFTFSANFVVMDIEEDTEIPLILGRPFMLIANCVVDMGKGKMKMGVNDQKIKFDLFDAEKHLHDRNICSKMDELKNEMVLVARAKLAPAHEVICVKLVTLKKHLLGGNLALFIYFLKSLHIARFQLVYDCLSKVSACFV